MSTPLLETLSNINRHGFLAREIVSGLARTKDVSSNAMARYISGDAQHVRDTEGLKDFLAMIIFVSPALYRCCKRDLEAVK